MQTVEDGKKSRQRGDNWTQDEKDIFLQIMQASAPIIENKLTDTNTNKQKSMEWLNIKKKLKELSGKDRDVVQLKGFWRRLKISAKKNVSQHKRILNVTGGGQRPPSPSQDDLKIMDLCPTDFIVENNQFDSDGIFQDDHTNEQPQKQIEVQDTIIYDIEVSENVVNEADVSFVEDIITVADTENNEVHIETFTNQDRKKSTQEKDIMPVKVKTFKQKEKSHKVESANNNKAAILKSNQDLKKRTLDLLEEEYKLKLTYQKQELCHQQKRQKLEIDILLLEKEKKELEIKILRKSLE